MNPLKLQMSDAMVTDRDKLEEVKAFEQQILDAENKIARATSKLFSQEEILDNICREIQSLLGVDFVTISLVMSLQNTIETVHGISTAQDNWFNRARHYIEEDPDLRDIQADIVKTYKTEIISGRDKRFDRWLYETFHHQQFIRIFTPIILIRDESGKVNENWFEQYNWEKNFISRQGDRGEQHTVLEMNLLPGFDAPTVIGTIEAGYNNCEIPITHRQAVDLAQLAAERALDIRHSQLPYVLEIISENATRILQADWSTLHFLWDSDRNSHVYNVGTGCININNLLLQDNPPRGEGLGWQTIYDRKPKIVSGSKAKSLNPIADHQEGTTAAFPLLFDSKQEFIHRPISTTTDENKINHKQAELTYEGFLYIHRQDELKFKEDELRWGEVFASHAVDAIWHAIINQRMRNKASQLTTLHSVTQSLNQIPKNSDLLEHIAGNTLNALAADVVTIYEYIQTEKQFLTQPSVAGRLREEKMSKQISHEDEPLLLINYGKNVYARSVEESIFKTSPFIMREKIKSVAGVLLKVDTDIVGFMFINYRLLHSFSKEEKQIIDSLAASAAIAIKNQRWLQTLSDIDHQIITTLDQKELLKRIVQSAVNITGADVGEISRLMPTSQKLVSLARHPADEPVEPTWACLKMGEGIVGWVAQSKQSALVDDVQNDSRYKPYFTKIRSETCVPLFDKDGRVLGVLDVESRKTKAFDQRDLWRLKVLANLAVIAIQNAESNQKLANMKTIAAVAHLTSQIVHRMNGDVGAVKLLLQEAIDSFNQGNIEEAEKRMNQMQSPVNRVSNSLRNLKVWEQEEPQVLNLKEVIDNVIEQKQILPNIIIIIDAQVTNLPNVRAGKQQLIAVFENLIENAIDTMPDGGTLSISGKSIKRETEHRIELQISDTGSGITEENLKKIFQCGFTTKNDRGKMGLGLWLTQSQIESLDGDITVNSELGQGTQVTVILPAYNPKVQV